MTEKMPSWLMDTDITILATFCTEPVQYPAMIASRSGLHIPYAERRCRVLAEYGLLERVNGEITYRLTTDGRRYLDDGTDTLD